MNGSSIVPLSCVAGLKDPEVARQFQLGVIRAHSGQEKHWHAQVMESLMAFRDSPRIEYRHE